MYIQYLYIRTVPVYMHTACNTMYSTGYRAVYILSYDCVLWLIPFWSRSPICRARWGPEELAETEYVGSDHAANLGLWLGS